MAESLIIAFLISGGHVEVALRSAGGVDTTARFENTDTGLKNFAAWLESNEALGEQTTAHSCVASLGSQDSTFFSSPFVEFAYDATENTFIWSAERLKAALAAEPPSAAAMLEACASQHNHERGA